MQFHCGLIALFRAKQLSLNVFSHWAKQTKQTMPAISHCQRNAFNHFILSKSEHIKSDTRSPLFNDIDKNHLPYGVGR